MKYFLYCRKSTDDEDHQILSIESQRRELDAAFLHREGIEIVGRYEEARTAKVPGRPLFNEMLIRIERGEASGILVWSADRLARNSVDGGRIIYLLDTGVLKDLKFKDLAFENTAHGKFLLAILFGQSKFYVDNLSANVKRGNKTKVQNGWRPNMAPLGYLNNRETRTIIPDPDRFVLVRRMWDLMLTGCYSPRRITEIARKDWGFRTRRRRRIGGGPVPLSVMYRMFENIFYAGVLEWDGEVYPGKHPAMVSLAEFDEVQRLLGSKGRRRPQRHHTFACTGLIRCGECGLMITAETQVNRFGSHYVYYHCTKKRRDYRCRQPYISEAALESQLLTFLRCLAVHPEYRAWVEGNYSSAEARTHREHRLRSLAQTEATLSEERGALIRMRTRNLIGDEDFAQEKARLDREALGIGQRRQQEVDADAALEPLALLDSFSLHAASWFQAGTTDLKRLIIQTAGSNLVLRDRQLSISATIPFVVTEPTAQFPSLCPGIEDVRTLIDDPHFRDVVTNLQKVKRLVEERGGNDIAA